MNDNNKFWFTCNRCKHEFDSSLNNVVSGRWCPNCRHKTEALVFSWCADWDHSSLRGAKFSWCMNDETGRHFPFDVMLPNLGVIVEVDGAHHFRNVVNWGDDLAERQRRDVYKMQRAALNGFRVIRICQEDVWKAQDYWESVLHRAVHTGDKSVMILAQQPSLYDEHWKLMGTLMGPK